MATLTREEIFEKVQEVMVDALGADEDEVTEDAKLIADLGAESIDFLDIGFRLEKAFSIKKIEQSEMYPENVLNDPNYVQNNKVTDLGMQELRKRLPHANLNAFEASRNVDEFSDILTVDMIVRFVETKLD